MARNPRNQQTREAEVLPRATNPSGPGFTLEPFFKSAPLIDGESGHDFQAFQEACLRDIAPKGALEKIWAQDVIGYSWDVLRLRRLKVEVLRAGRKHAVAKLLGQYRLRKSALDNSIFIVDEDYNTALEWEAGEPDAVKKVRRVMERYGLGPDAIMAIALQENLDTIEQIDRLIDAAEFRRNAILRDLEKRRDLLARRARQVTDSGILDLEAGE